MTSDGARDPKRRVVLSDMTRLLAAIVREVIGREPDLVYVGNVALTELPTALPSLRPDVLVLAAPRSDRARAAREELRRGAPDLTVVEIRPRDDRAVVWRPRSRPQHVDLSMRGIVEALRAPQRTAEGGAFAP